eukprot:4615102-Amphidinium_carterae.1
MYFHNKKVNSLRKYIQGFEKFLVDEALELRMQAFSWIGARIGVGVSMVHALCLPMACARLSEPLVRAPP